jgi:hypothetical protein
MDHTKQENVTQTERISGTGSDLVEQPDDERMTKAAWLGCLTLLIVQNAALQPIVISSVTKQIDDRIGMALPPNVRSRRTYADLIQDRRPITIGSLLDTASLPR